jgi:NADH-quinone oxidoreductase subunit C
MNPAERLAEVVGPEAAVSDAYGLATVDVPASAWPAALTYARDDLGCTYFDWLSAVDELEAGFRVVVHVANLTRRERLLVRTLVPREAPRLATLVGVYKGASWHERETHEMFGVTFDGHPNLVPLLLPDGFEGHPLRKEFQLAARAAKPWPGAKEPGESDKDVRGGAASPSRRRIGPPGVPDPDAWGPRPAGVAPKEPAAKPERPTRSPRKAAEPKPPPEPEP